MRIGDYSSHGHQNDSRSAFQRTQAFRRRFQVGQTVVGRFLRWERPGLAWIGISDLELLAGIDGNPAPGAHIVFLVMQLEPDIILKEIPQTPGTAISLKEEATFFFQLRDTLETRFDRLQNNTQLWSGPTLPIRRKLFFEHIRAIPHARKLLRDIQLTLRHINSSFPPEHNAKLHYAPWHAPGLLRHECLIRSAPSETEIIEYGHLPGCGAVQLHLLFSGKHPRARLELELPRNAEAVRKHLADEHLPGFGISAQDIPVSPLAANHARGTLANRIALSPHPSLRLNLKV